MTLYPQESIENLVTDILSVIDSLTTVSNHSDKSLVESRQLCSKIPSYIREGVLRVAVVGVIKSGKSTFINAFSGRELVQRRAGVVTSITTRIRKGKKTGQLFILNHGMTSIVKLKAAWRCFPARTNPRLLISDAPRTGSNCAYF